MKFKSLLLVVAFIPAMVMAQAHLIVPPVGSGTPSAGTPGANGGGIKPGGVPLAVKPTPTQAKPAVEIGLPKGLPPSNPITPVGYGASSVGLTSPTIQGIAWDDSTTAAKPQ